MDTLAEWALANLEAYGAPVLLFLAFIGSLGIPFPVTLVIITAGALAQAGVIDWWAALLAGLAGATLADTCLFLLGRWAMPHVEPRLRRRFHWDEAKYNIQHQGIWAILLTRFWLTPLAPAVSMIAGSRYRYARFLFFDLIGELVWVAAYGGLGYFFGSQQGLVSQAASNFTGLSVGLVILTLLVYIIIQRRLKSKRQRRQRSQYLKFHASLAPALVTVLIDKS